MTLGLTSNEAAARLASHGPNALPRERSRGLWRAWAAQLASPLVLVLVVACIVSALVGELADAIAIGAILLLNATIGALQERRAERAIAALATLTAPRARVLRDGEPFTLPATEVVPGDLLVLEAGDLVAADARVLEAHRLMTQEAALTGESAQVEKTTHPHADDAPLAERHDQVFMGTSVTTGRGFAEVTATGLATELGRIATLLGTAQRDATPLESRLARLGRTLMLACLAIVVVVAALGLVHGAPLALVALGAISLAVAAVPEGLPAIVTIALSIGVRRMAERNVYVRRLAAVETLGCATIVCTDKTGTLTTGHMSVREIWGADHHRVLEVAAACCDASLDERAGDTMELAILEAAFQRGIVRATIERERTRLIERPFDADRRLMSIARSDGVLYVKGAVEALLARASHGQDGVVAAADELARDGLRVIAVAVGSGADERDLTLVGLLGLADPPRTGSADAVAAAHRAGIDVVMITGDHGATAGAIARELGITSATRAPADHVFARATPETKIALVRALKESGAVVAMTGDGVNDGPALREAHIGIAMGRSGTEVARAASDMVLADDDFASIVAAVREGRAIFDNIRKALAYLLTGNVAELLVMLLAAAFGWPPPLLPLHLLWVNLVTDALPALALVADPIAHDLLDRPPRPPREPIIGAPEWRAIAFVAAIEGAAVTLVYALALEHGVELARGMAFSTLVTSELLRALGARSATASLEQTGVLANLRLLVIVVTTVLVQLGLHFVPATRTLFDLAPLDARDVLVIVGAGSSGLVASELWKLARRRASTRAPRAISPDRSVVGP